MIIIVASYLVAVRQEEQEFGRRAEGMQGLVFQEGREGSSTACTSIACGSTDLNTTEKGVGMEKDREKD